LEAVSSSFVQKAIKNLQNQNTFNWSHALQLYLYRWWKLFSFNDTTRDDVTYTGCKMQTYIVHILISVAEVCSYLVVLYDVQVFFILEW
jgi:hypothetical protein